MAPGLVPIACPWDASTRSDALWHSEPEGAVLCNTRLVLFGCVRAPSVAPVAAVDGCRVCDTCLQGGMGNLHAVQMHCDASVRSRAFATCLPMGRRWLVHMHSGILMSECGIQRNTRPVLFSRVCPTNAADIR